MEQLCGKSLHIYSIFVIGLHFYFENVVIHYLSVINYACIFYKQYLTYFIKHQNKRINKINFLELAIATFTRSMCIYDGAVEVSLNK